MKHTSYTSALASKDLKSKRQAFTLIEVLVVVAMIALIVAATAPMIFSSLVSTRLTSAGETLSGQISYARQLAVSRSETIELRFYRYEDPETPGAKPAYRAMAIMSRRARPNAAATGLLEQLSDTYFLPSGIVLGDAQRLSPILASGFVPTEQDAEKVIKRARDASYKAFLIMPDGSTNLEFLMNGQYKPNETYLTLAEERVLEDKDGAIPKNFFTVQIDPATGRTSTYRP